MRRALAGLCIFLLALSLLGCGNAPDETQKSTTRRTEDPDRGGTVKPDGKDPGKPTETAAPDDSKSGLVVPVTWANWQSFIEFYKVEDRTKAIGSSKEVYYTFGVRAKEGFTLRELSIKMNATLYYRAGNADMKEHVEKDIILTMDSLTYTIRFKAEDLINYNGRTVESVYYDDIFAITGRVQRK
ncbi:MAG: hypothetical protein IKG97_07190 [Lachnospiraceae bacterium]|nr:hypothetical protein [Lachnospiraceae bacterium]